MKKLISGSCPYPIIQSYINNIYIYIYIYLRAWSTQNELWSPYFFFNLFHNIQLFIIFWKWPHLISTSFYTRVSIPAFFSLFSKIEKPKIPFWRRRVDVWAVYFQKFFDVYFLPYGFLFEMLRICYQVF